MKALAGFAIWALVLLPVPALAQEDLGEVIVTARMRTEHGGVVAVVERRPVIGLKRQADSAVRPIEITSDSLDSDMRQREVQAMLLAAIDRARSQGLSLVTGQFEVIEVTRESWRDQFPVLSGKADADEDEDDEDDYDDDNDSRPKPGFEDDGSTATVRLMVKTRLDGTIDSAKQKIAAFVKGVPPTGRSQIEQKGGMALTIVNPEQYRDEIYRRIAEGTKHALGFYGTAYGVDVTGLDREIAWAQVSNSEVFLYIPCGFTVKK